ncbi:MAG: TolC family protein [candidate division FCPU426 bacterium]
MAQTLDWESLPDLVSKAPATVAAKLRTQAAEVRKGHLGRSFQPKANLSVTGVEDAAVAVGGIGPREDVASTWMETSGELSMNLWNGDRDSHKDASFEAEATAARQDASRDYAQRLSEARKAWLDAWLASQRLEIFSKIIDQGKDSYQRAEIKANAGQASQTDLVEFELRLQELDLELVKTQEERDAGLFELASILALSGEGLELGAGISSWPEARSARETAGPEELALLAEAEARSKEAASQGIWPFPSLDAELKGPLNGPATSLDGPSGYEARLGLALVLWDAGQASVEGRYFEFQAKALTALAEGAKKERIARREFSARRLARWNGMAKPLKERQSLAEKFRDKVSEEYARGIKDERDLGVATQAVFDASSALLEAQAEAWHAWLDFERLQP